MLWNPTWAKALKPTPGSASAAAVLCWAFPPQKNWIKLCLLCWQNSGICVQWQSRERERKLFYWRLQRHLRLQPAAACFRGMQPQADPSEQDYSPVVKHKLLSQSRVPLLECKQWTGRRVGSGGEVSPRGWWGHPREAQAQHGSLMGLWHGAGVPGRSGESPQGHLGTCPSTRLVRWGFGDRSFLKRHYSNDITLSRAGFIM